MKFDETFSTVRSRIDKILSIKRLSQTKFAEKCKLNPTTLSKAIKVDKLSTEIIDSIYRHMGIRIEFLESGELPVELKEFEEPKESELPDLTALLNTLQKALDTISKQNNSIIETNKDLRKQNDRMVTMIEDLTRFVVSKKEKQNL